MVRSPSAHDEEKLKKGPWTPEEDQKLVNCINKHGHASWRAVPRLAGLNRCGKSCRLRWKNYLQPDIKRGKFSDDEEKLIINLHSVLGNKWSKIASHLPGRTDNEIKNFWNTNLSKKLLQMGIDPKTHKPRTDLNHLSQLLGASHFDNFMFHSLDLFKLQSNTTQLSNFHVLQHLLQILNTPTLPCLNHNETTLNNFFPNSLNPSFINPKLPGSFQGTVVDSSMLNINDIGGFDLQGVDGNNNSSVINNNADCYNHVNIKTDDYSLPKLLSVSASPSPEMSCIVNHLETNNNLSNATTPPHASNMFEEDWERLMNEGITESYWNDILTNDLLD